MNVIHIPDRVRLQEEDLPEKTWKGNEKYLQKILADNPELLQERFDFPLVLVYRELKIEAGHIDIFLIDSQGLPVLVEVKLLANPQSEREVVGQIISYASSLPQLNFDELNSRVKMNWKENYMLYRQLKKNIILRRNFFVKNLKMASIG